MTYSPIAMRRKQTAYFRTIARRASLPARLASYASVILTGAIMGTALALLCL